MSYLDTIRRLGQKSETALEGSTHPHWLTAWREIAALTVGITQDDHRFALIVKALDSCDEAYLAGEWSRFQQAAEQVKSLVAGSTNG
jgi:hypothetical protein